MAVFSENRAAHSRLRGPISNLNNLAAKGKKTTDRNKRRILIVEWFLRTRGTIKRL
ncbi:hypothetical cytosolic protein [Syntrophus aciditrophicus SB]|uniref:Hypothetical cytosolic protein n=1 Tax=Syntrophus aciditrophicus (strain SB) TaxID=56780 RepID=Q2LV60_SYNAS|nr:hypothetical cytosolic protein [Syntrophus aciditrophicus SB]